MHKSHTKIIEPRIGPQIFFKNIGSYSDEFIIFKSLNLIFKSMQKNCPAKKVLYSES